MSLKLITCQILFSVFGLSTLSVPAAPQQNPVSDISSHKDWPAANQADVATIESTVQSFYSVLSVPATEKLDLKRLRSLFVPSGRIAVGLAKQKNHPADVLFLTLEQYALNSDAYTAKEGVFDHNPVNQIDQFGVMAHVYSTYESRSHPGDTTPFARGIKSFELLHSGDRWYILQVYWDAERPGNPLPELYLHNSRRP